MVIIENKDIKGIPVLIVVQDNFKNEQLPLIMFIHGFTSAKEHNLHYAYLLAEKGFRVVLPDALYHGERKKTEQNLMYLFWEIVINEIKEIEMIKNELEQQGLIENGKIGLVGTSMGGITTLGALTQFPWIKVAVSLMGCPSYQRFATHQIKDLMNGGIELPFPKEELDSRIESLEQFDLSLSPEKLNNRPLLFWHGENDLLVPFHFAYQFFDENKTSYYDQEHIQFIRDTEAGHKVSREGVLATVKWFERFL